MPRVVTQCRMQLGGGYPTLEGCEKPDDVTSIDVGNRGWGTGLEAWVTCFCGGSRPLAEAAGHGRREGSGTCAYGEDSETWSGRVCRWAWNVGRGVQGNGHGAKQ